MKRETGLKDSNGKMIKEGDLIRYEYKNGIVRLADGTILHVFPYDEVVDESHETVIKFEVRGDSAGYFLDMPQGISSAFFKNTIKYYIK